MITQTTSLTESCYQQLKADLVNGVYAPGAKLPIEALKLKYKVGGSPLREALSRLVNTGFVVVEGKKGFKAANVSESYVRDIYQTYSHIETLALQQAIEQGDAEWEAEIMAALHRLAKVENQDKATEYAVWHEQNYRFHVALIKGCQSPCLLDLRERVYWQVERFIRLAFDVDHIKLKANHQEHRALADAVLKRDKKQATALIQAHIIDGIDSVIESLQKNKVI